MLAPEALLGTWVLDDFRIEFDDGRPPRHPLGADATGQLSYTADGWMAAFLSAAGRTASTERLENAQRIPSDVKVAAFDSMVVYGGRWSLDGDTVVHHVEHSLFPGLVGVDNRRLADLTGDRLELSYTLTPRSGVQRRYRLRWRRP